MSFAETISENISTFLSFTGFANATSGHLIMILIGLIFLYLGIAKKWEPMLLVPIGFGILVGNIPFQPGFQIGIYEDGSVLSYLYLGVVKGFYPPLIFLGEKMDALDVFYPSRMADRILGMGDIVSFVEKAQEQFDEEEARKIQKKFAKNQYNFNDFMAQIQQIKKMGNVKDLIGMIPGMGKAVKNMDIDENAFKSIEAIIQSMTPEEREALKK